MTYTPSPHHEHEERERVEESRLAAEKRRERFTDAMTTHWTEWWNSVCKRRAEVADTIDPHHDDWHLTTLLGVHAHWQGPVADAAKAFLRQLLEDVEERDREAREKLKLISQEKFSPPHEVREKSNGTT